MASYPQSVLDEIRSGAFAREWRAEHASGERRLGALTEAARRHPIEAARRRALGGAPAREGSQVGGPSPGAAEPRPGAGDPSTGAGSPSSGG